jgi:hypothetical protein
VTEVSCDRNGKQAAAYISKHLAQALHDEVSRGIHFGQADEAWRDECEEELSGAGEWTSELMAKSGITLICASCLDNAKRINALRT